jgi:hypothetical protein
MDPVFTFCIFVPMNLLKKISAIFLAAVFLFSSMSFTVGSMVCLKSGKGETAFSRMEDCCSKKKETSCCEEETTYSPEENVTYIGKAECCAINNLSIQLKDFSPSNKLSLEQPAILHTLFAQAAVPASYIPEQKLSFQFTDLPPPYHGRALLNFISTLLI